jgi:hypothetical protein
MGQFEQWIAHYDFGTHWETYQFERHTKPDGRALLREE